MIKYSTIINEIGPNAKDFLEEDMMVIFGNDAPPELRPYCFLVEHNGLKENIMVGDQLVLDTTTYEIIGLGDQVNKNLNDLSHITLNFKGQVDDAMAGTLYLENKKAVELNVGSKIVIESKEV